MLSYIIRRILYAVPILIGVNVIVFFLFFFVNTPDDMARLHLGEKRITPEQIHRWKRERSLDLPMFLNFGWVQLGSIQAEKEVNEKTFSLNEGEYEIWIDTPENKELASEREIELELTGIQLPHHLVELRSNTFVLRKDVSKTIILPAETGRTLIPFEVYLLKSKDAKKISEHHKRDALARPQLRLSFKSSQIIPNHRVTLHYKGSIPLWERFTHTIFFTRSLKMLFFQYGRSDDGKLISDEAVRRAAPSLVVTLPTFIIGLILNIFTAMILAFFRGSSIDYWGVFLCVVGMSISILFYIIFGQVILGKWMKLFPISGFEYGYSTLKFIAMPVGIAILGGMGGSVRFYRNIFLEEINKEYVLTARAKGIPEHTVLFLHVLKNAMIPILTGVVVYLPFLFIGSLLLESFFAIPGLGAYLLEAIQRKDFAIVQAMVSLGSFFYIIGLIMTDISYTIVDPRVRLH